MTIDLYLTVLSPPCRTVQFVAKQLGIDINLKDVNLLNGDHLKPEYTKLNPQNIVPTLVDDGLVLWESRAIAQYLCNKYAPDSQLYPSDPNLRAIVDRVLNFDIGTFVPSLRESLGAKLLAGKEPEEGKVDALKKNLRLLNTFIGDNNYVAANHLTIADLSFLSNYPVFKLSKFDLSEYPRVKQWFSRLESELPYYEELQGNVVKQMPALLEKLRANPQQQANLKNLQNLK